VTSARVAAETENCLDEALLLLPAYPTVPELPLRIADYRRALLGEFDRPDTDVVLDLARLYIAHGLGAEARAALDAFGPVGPPARALSAIASLIDSGADLPAPVFTTDECGPRYRLWRAFEDALNGSTARAVVEASKLKSTLERQPGPIRSRLAITFGLAALDIDDAQLAEWMRNLAERDSYLADPAALGLLQARLATHTGDNDRAIAILDRTRADAGAAAARALILLAGLSLDGPAELALGTHRLRLDLGAAARQWRGDRLGADLFAAEVKLVAAASGKADALDLLDYGLAAGLISPAARERVLAAISSGRTDDADAVPLAVLYHARPGRFETALTDSGFREALARSYAEIGVPYLAVNILDPGDLSDRNLAAVLARAALEGRDSVAARWLLETASGSFVQQAGLEALAAMPAPGPMSPPDGVTANDDDSSTEQQASAARSKTLGPDATIEAAAVAAIGALDAGAPEIPKTAFDRLAAENPEVANALARAFPGADDPGRVPSPTDTAYLEQLDDELTALGGLLHDG